MNYNRNHFATHTVLMIALGLFSITVPVANAYSIYPDASTTQNASASYNMPSNFNFGGTLGQLSAPFQSFLMSIGSISASDTNININLKNGSLPSVQIQSAIPAGVLSQFDNWFYGITRFHIMGVINGIGGIFLWIFGVLNGVAMWLASLVHF